jgi:hypothetical protein
MDWDTFEGMFWLTLLYLHWCNRPWRRRSTVPKAQARRIKWR